MALWAGESAGAVKRVQQPKSGNPLLPYLPKPVDDEHLEQGIRSAVGSGNRRGGLTGPPDRPGE